MSIPEIGNIEQQAVAEKILAGLDPQTELFNQLKEVLKVADFINFYPIPVGSTVGQFEVTDLPAVPNFFALTSENTGETVVIVPGGINPSLTIVNRPALVITNQIGPQTVTLDTPKLPYLIYSVRYLDFVTLGNFTPYLIIGYKNPLR
jgi:hypothetical protein